MKTEPPRMGRPPKPAEDPFCLEPLPVGCVVTARATVPAFGLRENWPYKVTAVAERQLIPGRGNPKRYVYGLDGGEPMATVEMLRYGGPVCAHPFPAQK